MVYLGGKWTDAFHNWQSCGAIFGELLVRVGCVFSFLEREKTECVQERIALIEQDVEFFVSLI